MIPSDNIDVKRVQAMLIHLSRVESLVKTVRENLDVELGTVKMAAAASAIHSMADNVEIAKSMLSGFNYDRII